MRVSPFRQFRNDALAYFRQQVPLDTPVAADDFARAHKHFSADEEFPQFIGRDSLLYMRSSYKRIPAFVIRDLSTGQETRLRNRAISLDNYFSRSASGVVYAAYETDPRWGWRDYSVIRLLDPRTGEDRRLTSRSRYFSPDLSADGHRVVTVQEAADGSCTLFLLDAANGSVVKQFPNPDKLFYTYPKFYADGLKARAAGNVGVDQRRATRPTGYDGAVTGIGMVNFR